MPYDHYKDPEAQRVYQKDYQQSYRPAHRDKINLQHKLWRASHPEHVKELKKLYYARHRDERLAYNVRWRAENPEKQQLATKRWRDKHREEVREYDRTHPGDPILLRAIKLRHKARKRAATLGPVNLEAIFKRDKGVCQLCGRRVKPNELSFDHIIPLALGGSHTEDNLQVAHRVCNSRKGMGYLPSQMRLAI